MWLRFARCVAHSIIVVAGKFASILICGLDYSSCVTHSRNIYNRFYVLAFLVVRDLRLRFELRNSQPQFVFRFCNFLDVNLQDFVWKFFAEELFLIPENGTYRPRPRCGGTPKFRWPPNLDTRAVPFGTIKVRLRYFCGAAIQSQSNNKVLPNCPPITSYISYLI